MIPTAKISFQKKISAFYFHSLDLHDLFLKTWKGFFSSQQAMNQGRKREFGYFRANHLLNKKQLC